MFRAAHDSMGLLVACNSRHSPGIPPAQSDDMVTAAAPSHLSQVLPPGGSLISGVYTLLSTGALPPSHSDHPAQRRRASDYTPKGSGPWARVTLDDAGLDLCSAAVLAHGQEPILTTKTASFAGG